MKKSFVFLTAMLASALTFAQSVDYYLANSGRVWNRVETNAVAVDSGTSNNRATSSMSSTASGYVSSVPIPGGQTLALSGTVATQGSGMAFNVSTGNATGYAMSQGWADAGVTGYNRFANEHGTLALSGSTDSGMVSPVGHGVDVNVSAGRSQDGYAAGGDGGSFTISGYTTQVAIPGGAAVAASITDTKESNAWAEAGAVTFTGGTPAGQSAAYRTANSGNVTEASGAFLDPAH